MRDRRPGWAGPGLAWPLLWGGKCIAIHGEREEEEEEVGGRGAKKKKKWPLPL